MTARDLPDLRDAWSILGQVTGWPERPGRLTPGASRQPQRFPQGAPAWLAPGVVRGRAE
ncbi:hypothetical protein [Brevundimonas sp.]|uniref:hypothetical protein n=1 Tax=Brevundimonas sp. TaxID=1871086 RepID=UPI002D62CE02|nr:hypothetical protein [Brevundimonas sp.]HYD26922.1 hypothetical protein [Brevundimonas sp.]